MRGQYEQFILGGKMMQIKARRNCYECRDIPSPDCPECKGTGWVEMWVDLAIIAKAIEQGDPAMAEALANLAKLGL